MERFFCGEKVTPAVIYFWFTDCATGKVKSAAFKAVQKAISSLQKTAPMSQQRALIVATNR